MSQKTKVCLVSNQTEYSILKKVEANLEKDWSLELSKALLINSFEISTLIKSIILVMVNSNADVKELIDYMVRVDVEKIRVIVLSSTVNDKIEKTLHDAGCAKIYLTNTAWPLIKESIESEIAYLNNETKTSIIEVEPLTLQADCWYLEKSSHLKKVNGIWYLYIIGPEPNTGKWIASDKTGKEDYYEFIPNTPIHSTLVGERGTWFFKGKKPIFENCFWHFIGKDPQLCFVREELHNIYRLKSENKNTVLSIARNSEICKAKLRDIEDSHYAYYKYEKKADVLGDLKADISSEFNLRLNSRLTGKVATIVRKKIVDLEKDNKYFNIVDSLIEKKKYLNAISSHKNNLVVWTRGQKTVLGASATKIKDGQYSITFDDTNEGSKLIENLSQGIEGDTFVRGNIDEASIFFKIEGPSFELSNIKILIPNLMWKVQRRKFSRVRLDGRKKTKASIKLIQNNKMYTISAPVRNIGAGGMSILVDDIHQGLFETGLKVNEVKFILDEEIFFAMAQIKWKSHVQKREALMNLNFMIGLEFLYLSQKESDFIQRFVLEQMHENS